MSCFFILKEGRSIALLRSLSLVLVVSDELDEVSLGL